MEKLYVDGGVGGWEGGPDMTTIINPQLPALPFRRQQPPFFSCSLPREDVKIFIDFFFKKKDENPDYKRKVWWIYILPFIFGLKTVSVSLLSAWIRFAFMVASNFKEQGMNLIKVYLHT